MSLAIQQSELIDSRPSATKGRILILHTNDDLPQNIKSTMDQLCLSYQICDVDRIDKDIIPQNHIDAALIILDNECLLGNKIIHNLIDHLHKEFVPVIIVTNCPPQRSTKTPISGVTFVPMGESSERLIGRIETLIEMNPTIKRLTREIQRLDKIAQPVNTYITQLDEEMRLAARLQRDFLPLRLPQLPGIRFAAIYRPATWVSGDIYDVMRLDEEHVGFYIADAVGHGMPAALLTMFIKRALITKVITGNSYELVEPGVALARLGSDMVDQELSNFQFATCCYAILNIKTLRLRIANAGHPPPMIIHKNSDTTELDILGCLLGVFPEQTYDTKEYQLKPDDKLLMYSDGVELAFVNEGPDKPLRFRKEFGDLAHCDIETMCNRLLTIINQEEGSLHPRDDVTIVGLELLKSE